jgi:molybdopterin synthase catalytic subunit
MVNKIGKTHTTVSLNKIDSAVALDFVTCKEFGAIASFTGVVRNNNFGREVVGISYDIFEPLANNIFKDLCQKAREQFGDLNIYICHYKGDLKISEIAVVIAVGSKHRKEAFDACRFLIEELKHQAPIWKKEYYTDGETNWVKGHTLCSHK